MATSTSLIVGIWIGIAVLGLLLYLVPAILKSMRLEGFASGLTSNPNLQPIDPNLIADLGLDTDVLKSFTTQIPKSDLSDNDDTPIPSTSLIKPTVPDASVTSNKSMTPPVTGNSPNVLSPGLKQTNTTQLNVNPTELADVANLLTTIKTAVEAPDTAPASTTKSSPAAAATKHIKSSGAETQGAAYHKKNKDRIADMDNVTEYKDSEPTDSSAYAPIDAPSPSQLLQCPACPKCKPQKECPRQKKCPPQQRCPDLTDYIRKDSIPCWNCKLK